MKALLTLTLFAVAAACSFPTHTAKKVVELKLPADVQTIACDSENGDITVVGDAAATEIALHAEIEIRAFSQAEADTTLDQMTVLHEIVNGRLDLRGKYPQPLSGKIVQFTFSLRVPPRMQLSLETHNGTLKVDRVDGDLALESHNGSIAATTRAKQIDATTHNGEVRITAATEGALNGTITSHNGEVRLDVGEHTSTVVDASTGNGNVTAPADATTGERRKRDTHRECRFGDGAGRMSLETHNGNVDVRRASAR